MLIWAFVPYAVRGACLEGFDFDSLQTKRELALAFRELNLAWIWQPIVESNIDAIVAQAAAADSTVLNLCDGIGEQGTPGLGVVRALERANVRFTGADSEFYGISTSKMAMKKRMASAGVSTPAFEELSGDVSGTCSRIGTPLLVKPDVSAASAGVFLRSKVESDRDAEAVRAELAQMPLPPFCEAKKIFAERFIDGPEFTVFVTGNWRQPETVRALRPVERVFNTSVPDGEKFLSYERYWGHYREEAPPADGLPFYVYTACDPSLEELLTDISRRAYIAVHGRGYARVDIRMDRAIGEPFVLEVNANCWLSEDDQTSTGCILREAGMSLAELLDAILRT